MTPIPRQSTWWARATQEQKLAQVKGGTSKGIDMTARQVAMNCGFLRHGHPTPEAVTAFANNHGLHFNGSSVTKDEARIASGHRVFRKKMESIGESTANSIYARIFPREHSESLFDFHPYEENV